MIYAIDNGMLLTDLDSLTLDILNCSNATGADNVIYSADARMSDKRNILDGTVTNDSVAANAAIVQTKLSLDGDIPSAWLGTTDATAAQGDLVERLANKNVPNGYAGLTGGGKLPSGTVPLSGTGTVTELSLVFPFDFWVIPDVSTTAWTFTQYWAATNPESFFGNMSGVSAPPGFVDDPFPLALVPNLDAAQITTGKFAQARLPVAVGVGGSHASGTIPVTDGEEGLASDYLARDMTFKPMATTVSYQPTLPDPAISILSYAGPSAYINITESVKGVNLFYQLAPAASTTSPFVQVEKLPLLLQIGTKLMVYAAKIGYNNSGVVKYTIPDPDAGV